MDTAFNIFKTYLASADVFSLIGRDSKSRRIQLIQKRKAKETKIHEYEELAALVTYKRPVKWQ